MSTLLFHCRSEHPPVALKSPARQPPLLRPLRSSGSLDGPPTSCLISPWSLRPSATMISIRAGVVDLRNHFASCHPGDRSGQLRRVDGLAYVVIHSGDDAFFSIAIHGAGGHGDDRDVSATGTFTRSNGGGGFETIHLGHLHIHEDEVERFAIQRRQSLEPVIGNHHGMTLFSQQVSCKLLIYGVIFG